MRRSHPDLAPAPGAPTRAARPLPLLLAAVPLALAAAALPPRAPDAERERAEVLAVIARETEAYYREDFAAWRDTYVQAPYVRVHGYWEGFDAPVVHYAGFDTLAAVKRKQFAERTTVWKGSREERRNVNVRVRGDVAWVTFEQDSFEHGTNKPLGRSLEARVLEKQGGRWRIAYLGYHYYPEQQGRSARPSPP